MTLAASAIAYATAGIAVFPLMPRDKRPFGHTPGLHAATKDPVRAEQWWGGHLALPLKDGANPRLPVYAGPRANIGIATGKISGFWVLDIDGEAGAASLAALEAQHGALPATPEQSTGKGRHICFADPVDGPEVRNSASKIGEGIDVRGDGGYIVAAPSIHPSGRVYAWAEGRGPGDLAFAPAPDWLIALASPPPPPPRPEPANRVAIEGRASRYGEAVLTGASRDVEQARPGTQSDTLWDKSVYIGAFVAGGEIERAYAWDAMVNAGLNMVASGKPWTRPVVESAVNRAFAWAEGHPRNAPQLRNAPQAQTHPSASRQNAEPKAMAGRTVQDAREVWDGAAAVDAAIVGKILAVAGLDPALARWPQTLRFVDRDGGLLLLPMSLGKGQPLDAVAVARLQGGGLAVTDIIGQAQGRAGVLSPWSDAEDLADVVVAIDIADGWSLGAAAQESGDPLGVVIAPTLSAFAGKPLPDRFGRISVETPTADFAAPAWTVSGGRQVYLAVRNDLFSAPLRVRKFGGGTAEQRLTGDAAAQFFGSLASQSWRKAGAAGVRILRPSAGRAGFHTPDGSAA